MSLEDRASSNLSLEFESSLVAIAAVAFAMESLKLELKSQGHVLDSSLYVKPAKTNAGFYIGHWIVQAFDLQGPFVEELPARLEEIFDLRNKTAHFESELRDSMKPHPSGTTTAEELTIFTFEVSLKSVRLGRAIINECKLSVENGKSPQASKHIAPEFAGVLAMLDEILETEELANTEMDHSTF